MDHGILMLDRVPTIPGLTLPFAQKLQKCIRTVSDSTTGRDIPTEDFLHRILSYTKVRDGMFVVRFSNVDSKGRVFGHLSLMNSLYSAVTTAFTTSGEVITQGTDDPRYDHFYNQQTLSENKNGRDYLFVPNSKNCISIVILLRSAPTIDCTVKEHAVT